MAQRCQPSTGCLLLLSFAYPPTHRLVIVVPVFSCFPFSCFSLFWFFLFLCLQLLVVWPIFLLASVMMRGFCNNRGSHLSLSIHGGPLERILQGAVGIYHLGNWACWRWRESCSLCQIWRLKKGCKIVPQLSRKRPIAVQKSSSFGLEPYGGPKTGPCGARTLKPILVLKGFRFWTSDHCKAREQKAVHYLL